MNRLFLLLVISSLPFLSSAQKHAQKSIGGGNQKKYASQPSNHNITTRSKPQETVSWPSRDETCSKTLTSYHIVDDTDSGFYFGTNSYKDLGKGQVLTFEGNNSFKVVGGIAYFNQAKIVGDGNITAEVYTLDASGAPDKLIVVSNPLKSSELTPPTDIIQATIFSMPEEGNLSLTSPNFLLNINFTDLYSSNDSVGLYSTLIDCGNGDNTWEKWSDGAWHSMSDPNGWNFHLDIALEAIVEFSDATSADAHIHHNGITIFPAFPNPANQKIQLKYSIEKFGLVQIYVFDTQGKLIKNIKKENQSTGVHFEDVELKNFAPGTYYYQVTTKNGTIASRFTKS